VGIRFFYGPSSVLPAWPAFLLAAFLFVVLCSLEIRAWSLGFSPSLLSIALIVLVGGFVFTTGYRLFDR
jgi:hypothetical protein